MRRLLPAVLAAVGLAWFARARQRQTPQPAPRVRRPAPRPPTTPPPGPPAQSVFAPNRVAATPRVPAPEAEPAIEFDETEPVIVFAPLSVADAEPVPAVARFDEQVQKRLQRVWAFIRRRRRLFLAVGIVLVTVALVVGPALARDRRSSRWERCVEQVMGRDVHAGDRLSMAAADECGLTPSDHD